MTRAILAVDDSASIRQMVQLTLASGGYEVIQAVDGNDGLAKARGRMHARGVLVLPERLLDKQEVPVIIDVTDTDGLIVFTAEIRIWVTAKPPKETQ